MNEIKVLWLDDESEEFLANEDWRAQFEDEGITLYPEKFAIDAIERIKEDPKQWDLILLDAMGYKKEGSTLNTAGLTSTIQEILKAAAVNNVNLPYFIYTGQDKLFDDEEFTDSYPKEIIYSKSYEGTERLISNIKKLVLSKEDRILKDRYHYVFDAIDYLGLKQSEQKLLTFLKSIHSKDHGDRHYSIKDLRVILEEIFYSLMRDDRCIVPKECYLKGNREVNMADTIRYIRGEQTSYEFGRNQGFNGFGVIDLEGPVYPNLMASNIETIYKFSSAVDSHVKRQAKPDLGDMVELCMDYDNRLPGNYMPYSLVYQLCDVLMYTASYVKSHPNAEINRKRVFQLRDEINTGCVFEETDGILHFGEHCWADKKDFNKGDKVNLKQVCLKVNPREQYKFKILSTQKNRKN